MYREKLEQLTNSSVSNQNKNLRLFTRVDTLTKLKMLEHQTSIFHRLRAKYDEADKNLLTLASIILSIDKVIKELDDVSINVAVENANSVDKTPKRTKLLGYWSLVKDLRDNKGMSLRKIKVFLKKKYKLEVSYSTIHNVWHEIECDNQNKEKYNG